MSAANDPASVAARSFSIERTLAASVEDVFRLWTDPELVAQWWGINNCTIPRCELDVRVGGRWRIDMLTAGGALYRNQGTYLAVDPYRFLSYTDEPDPNLQEWGGRSVGQSTHRVTFAAEGGATRVHFEVTLASAADRERLLALGVRRGWSQSFDRLEQLLRIIATRGDL